MHLGSFSKFDNLCERLDSNIDAVRQRGNISFVWFGEDYDRLDMRQVFQNVAQFRKQLLEKKNILQVGKYLYLL
jgi:hypothetical protein